MTAAHVRRTASVSITPSGLRRPFATALQRLLTPLRRPRGFGAPARGDTRPAFAIPAHFGAVAGQLAGGAVALPLSIDRPVWLNGAADRRGALPGLDAARAP